MYGRAWTYQLPLSGPQTFALGELTGGAPPPGMIFPLTFS